MVQDASHIGILGSGAWGTALALSSARAGAVVRLWARRPEQAAEIERTRENRRYLPGLQLPPAVEATSRLPDMGEVGALLLAVPAQSMREVLTELAPHAASDLPLIVGAKGVERGSLFLMSEVAAACLPGRPLAVLSGPTFAREVAEGLPTAVTLAAEPFSLAERLAERLGSRTFRPYASNDVVGAQLGGAIKNVLAIACGIVSGRRLGDNARAALVTRGLAELGRLGLAKGARAETLMGLSGLGDLTLTCTSPQSRNFAFGRALGEGMEPAAALAASEGVAEGAFSAGAVAAMAHRHGIEMPLSKAVHGVVDEGVAIDAAIEALLARPFRDEGWDSRG